MNPFTLISPAYAQDVSGIMGSATQFAPLILIFAWCLFLPVTILGHFAGEVIAVYSSAVIAGIFVGLVWTVVRGSEEMTG